MHEIINIVLFKSLKSKILNLGKNKMKYNDFNQ